MYFASSARRSCTRSPRTSSACCLWRRPRWTPPSCCPTSAPSPLRTCWTSWASCSRTPVSAHNKMLKLDIHDGATFSRLLVIGSPGTCYNPCLNHLLFPSFCLPFCPAFLQSTRRWWSRWPRSTRSSSRRRVRDSLLHFSWFFCKDRLVRSPAYPLALCFSHFILTNE